MSEKIPPARLFDADTLPDLSLERCAACGQVPENPVWSGDVIFCEECLERTREWASSPINDTLGGSE
jgi:hypothetical protein